MILSRPITSASDRVFFSTVSGFEDPYQPGPFNATSSQGSHGLPPNKAYQGSTSPDEYDTDMGGTTAGSSATSPENGVNEEIVKGHEKDVSTHPKMAAIPEYFANKKTKGMCYCKGHHLPITHPFIDGKVPKKRGPKPDSKPARDRRQELNRQAQR